MVALKTLIIDFFRQGLLHLHILNPVYELNPLPNRLFKECYECC
jgi:hypothetical protein